MDYRCFSGWLSNRRCCACAQSGFTLLEVVIALAIGAVLLAVGVPLLRDTTVTQRVKSTASELYSDLAFARSEAIKRNAQVSVIRASGGWASGWSVQVAGNTLRAQGEQRDVAYGGASVASVIYNPDGRSTLASSTSFNFSSPSGGAVSMRCVVVTPSGRPAILTDSNRDGSCQNG